MNNSLTKKIGNGQIKINNIIWDKIETKNLNSKTNIQKILILIISIYRKLKNLTKKNNSQETSQSQINISKDNIKILSNSQKIIIEKPKSKKHKLFILILFLIFSLFLSFFIFYIISSLPLDISKKIKTKIHRLLEYSNDYDSFAYKKTSNYCHYFVDGEDYFEELFQILMSAKESIYISGFWLSPELFLRRPVDEKIYIEMDNNNLLTKDFGKNISRLMDILDYKANQDVKVYVLIFYEWPNSAPTNSKHTEDIFQKLNNKIYLIRFPSHSQKGLFWSNHEKLVIVDKIIGYLGGFDLCWGRYDNKEHPISEIPNKDNIYLFPFMDYANERIKDFSYYNDYKISLISRNKDQRLPWHDVHARIIGPAVSDLTKHFSERWNFAVMSELKEKGVISTIKNIADYKSDSSFWDSILKYFSNNDKPKYNAENFLEINEDMNKELEKEIYKKYKKMGRATSNVQALRSVSNWNINYKDTESSILKAYYELIKNSKHYIFIENQYFITKSWSSEERNKNNEDNKKPIRETVKNEIGYYIRKRIEKAYKNKENFKVYIFLPLLPDFEGKIDNRVTIQTILRYTYKAISRNNGLSLIEQLEKIMGEEWKNYISFYSLRNHGIINGIPKTEMIYIHSKLMIIDDVKVLIGSANINDRSLLGNRDSEFAVIIEEQKEDYYIMDGNNEYQAAKFAVGLRKKLMAEHLGINIYDSILDDPVSNKLYNFMKSRARDNTQKYFDLFKCYPDNYFTNYEMIKDAEKLKKEENKEIFLNKYMNEKDKIKGHIVEYPLYFLKEESLSKISGFFSVEEIIPENAFT